MILWLGHDDVALMMGDGASSSDRRDPFGL